MLKCIDLVFSFLLSFRKIYLLINTNTSRYNVLSTRENSKYSVKIVSKYNTTSINYNVCTDVKMMAIIIIIYNQRTMYTNTVGVTLVPLLSCKVTLNVTHLGARL